MAAHLLLYLFGYLPPFQLIGCGILLVKMMRHQILVLTASNMKVFVNSKAMQLLMVCLASYLWQDIWSTFFCTSILNCLKFISGSADILNQQFKMYTSLSQTHSDVKMVQSLVPIWEVCC